MTIRRVRTAFVLAVALLFTAASANSQETRQATGVKVGEVTDTSAIVWMRVTAKEKRNAEGTVRRQKPAGVLNSETTINSLEGSCPGGPGRVRLLFGAFENNSDAKTLPWVDVSPDSDFTHQFRLTGLKPATTYYFAAETTGPGGMPVHGGLRGQFTTAPPANQPANITFTVITCQGYRDVDHADGFHIYEAMAKLNPRFFIPAGDNVYYDSDDPRATTLAIARYHWHRMHSFPRHIAFHLRVPGYWEKDDHDTYFNDGWPNQVAKAMLPFTYAEGLRTFREQVPMGEKTYRTFRWGKDLQVWMTEGRDFRTPNNEPDGPNKTLWGAEQKKWLKDTLLASDATWKVLISPTPIVGPDRPNKHDNQSNDTYAYEGNEFRQWAKQNVPNNFFNICGDRHWQYHSVHPQTGLHEFGCGPASDEHASGSPGEDPVYHRFHRVKGGFLSVGVDRADGKNRITFRHHDVHGKIVHEHKAEQ